MLCCTITTYNKTLSIKISSPKDKLADTRQRKVAVPPFLHVVQ